MKKVLLIALIVLLVGSLLFFLLRLTGRKEDRTVIEGLPSEVSKFLTEQDIEELQSHGFPIYFGLNPPNIEGTYFTDSTRVDFDKMNSISVDSGIRNYYRSFSNQTEELEITFGVEHPSGDYVRESRGGYISGDGNRFTVYQKMVNNYDGTIRATTVEMISGHLDEDNNIADFKIAGLMTEIRYPYSRLVNRLSSYLNRRGGNPMPEGNIRISSERDGVAERVE